MRSTLLIVAGLLGLLILATLIGCQAMSKEEADAYAAQRQAEIDALNDEIQTIRSEADAEIAALRLQLEQAELDAADRERATRAIEAVEEGVGKTLGVLETVRDKAQTALDSFEANRNPDGSVGPGAGASAIVSVLPQPWATYGGIALGVFGLIRSAVSRNAGRNLAESIEKARLASPQFEQVFETIKRQLRSTQTNGAQRLVREAKGEAAKLPV